MKKISNIIFIFILLATSFGALLAFPQKTEAVGIPNWLEATVETLTPDALYVSEKTYVQNGGDLGENQCWSFTSGLHTGNCLKEFARWLIKVIVEFVAYIAKLANILFSIAIYLSIRQFSTFVDSIEAINTGWKIIRDLMNLLFIGSLFYIAINTILQTSQANWKRDVPKIIIAALLINFSMLFTKIMIDASNLMTVTFYDNASSVNGTPQYVKWFGSDTNLDLGAGPIPDIATQITSIAVDHKIDKLNNRRPGEKKSLLQEIGPSLGKIFLLGVTAFVLLVAALLFIIRTIVLIFLLILSPFAFIGMILPKGQQFASQWWKNLTDQLLFAPAYMLCFFIVIQMAIASSGIKTAFGSAGDTYGASTLMLFVILTGMMFGCIFVAKSMGAKGAQWAQQTAGGALAAPIARFGQETAGRMAARRAEKLRAELQNPDLDPKKRARLESQLVRADKLSKATFDVRNTKTVQTLGKVGGADFGKGTDKSYAKRQEDKLKAVKEASKSLAPQTELEKNEAKAKNEQEIDEFKDQQAKLNQEVKDKEEQLKAGLDYQEAEEEVVARQKELNDIETKITDRKKEVEQGLDEEIKLAEQELAETEKIKGLDPSVAAEQKRKLEELRAQKNTKLEEAMSTDSALVGLSTERTAAAANLSGAQAIKQTNDDKIASGLKAVRDRQKEERDNIARNLEIRGGVDSDESTRLQEAARKEATRTGKDADGIKKAVEKAKSEYEAKQTKAKKHFESGGWTQEQYAKNVAAGTAGSFYVPFSGVEAFGVTAPEMRIPFTSDNPLASKRNRDTYAAAVKKQGGGESDEEALARIAAKLEKERKEKEDDDTPKPTPAPAPTTPSAGGDH